MKTIGIVGPLACGKGVVADFLIKEYGYRSFSLSSLVHEEAKKRGLSITRSILQDVGNNMRKRDGDGALAKRAIEKLTDCNLKLETCSLPDNTLSKKKFQALSYKFQKIIIEGIRNPGEVDYLRTLPGFFLIAVDASQKTRFQRVLSRAKPWDPIDWETFQKVDGRDSGESNLKNGQQVQKCMELADVRIENNGEVTKVQMEVEKIIKKLTLQ